MLQFKRYFPVDSLSADPQAVFPQMVQQVHKLFTHWVADRNFHRDFVLALDHAASMLMIDYLLVGGVPFPEKGSSHDLSGNLDLAVVKTLVADPSRRFYDETGGISHTIDTDFFYKHLFPVFRQWCENGYHPRDFTPALRDCGSGELYDFEIACSFGGTGGGLTGEQFLQKPHS